MATQTGSIDLKAATEAHEDASKTASKYITDMTNDGIMVHAEGDGPDDTATPSGWHISDVLEYIRQGVSRFWIGLKNSGDTTPTVRIGKAYVQGATDNELHMELDYHSLQMVDKGGNTYFHVSDLRGTDGYATIVERDDVPEDQSHEIAVSYPPRSVDTTTVVIDGTTTATVTSVRGTLDGHGVVVIAEELEEFVPVEVTYQTDSPDVKALTFGSRADGSSIGSHSVAIGRNNEVSGFYSMAEGANNHVTTPYAVALGANNNVRSGAFAAIGEGNTANYEGAVAIGSGLTASGLNQTVIGQNNVADTAGKYLFIVGNGPFLSSKSNAATIAWNGNYIAQAMAGIIQMFAGATAPDGWLICNGQAVSRTTYATLFAAIGTTWGTGDGSTTFNVPDLRGRAPIGAGTGSSLTARTLGGKGGAESVTLTAAQSGLPAHTHGFTNPKIPNHVHTMDHGHGFTQPKVNRAQNAGSGTNRYAIQGTDDSVSVSAHSGAVKAFDGNTGNPTSLGSTTGGSVGAVTGGAKDATNAHNNMQPFAVVNFIICTGKTS